MKSRPWITLSLRKSISVKNKLLKSFINRKDPILKEEFHTDYKKYRNLLSTLMKKSKQAYYNKYVEKNSDFISVFSKAACHANPGAEINFAGSR